MISTQNIESLPNKHILQKLCKAIASLDAVYSPDWHQRFYLYNSKWSENEEFFEMRDDEGNQVLILFNPEGCVINGFSKDFASRDLDVLTKGLPPMFGEFIFGEPVYSIGTTFCIWNIYDHWHMGEIGFMVLDNSVFLLDIFDNNPQTYINWAKEHYKLNFIPSDTVKQFYENKIIDNNAVLSLIPDFNKWGQLASDLTEIGYPFSFN